MENFCPFFPSKLRALEICWGTLTLIIALHKMKIFIPHTFIIRPHNVNKCILFITEPLSHHTVPGRKKRCPWWWWIYANVLHLKKRQSYRSTAILLRNMSTYNITITFTPVSYLIKLSEKEFGYFYEIPRGSWFGLVNKHGPAQ